MDNITLNTEGGFICIYQDKLDKYRYPWFKKQTWSPNSAESLLYIVIEHMCKPHWI